MASSDKLPHHSVIKAYLLLKREFGGQMDGAITHHSPRISETLFHKGDHFFDHLLDSCRRAKERILIEAYIFENDELGNELLHVLKQKVLEGLEVKILIDGIGSSAFDPKVFSTIKEIPIRVFNPLPFQRSCNQRSSVTRFLYFMQGLFFINNRNHRKIYLIDDAAYIGSINITAHHSHRLRGERSWRDTGLKITGPEVDLLEESFWKIWHGHLEPKHKEVSPCWKEKLTQSSLRINDCVAHRQELKTELLERIKSAQRRVWITNPYFVPDEELIEALEYAAKERGIDVSIIIPRKSDMNLFPLINSLAGRRLVENRIKVFEYLPRILHAKIMIIDNWCTIGSTNLNSRSFKHDLEVDVVLTQESNIRELGQMFLNDLSESVELKKRDILHLYGHKVFACAFLRLIKYWL